MLVVFFSYGQRWRGTHITLATITLLWRRWFNEFVTNKKTVLPHARSAACSCTNEYVILIIPVGAVFANLKIKIKIAY